MLSEAQVERILTEGFVLEDDIRWAPQPSNPNWLQFGAFLDAGTEASVRINMAVSMLRREKYKIVLLRGEQVLRRLDVRGSHRNPRTAGGESWCASTHKHRWTDIYADKAAYTPTDISASTFNSGEYEVTFLEFCGECNIDFRGQWQDPPEQRQGVPDI